MLPRAAGSAVQDFTGQPIVSELDGVVLSGCALIHVGFIPFGISIPFMTLAFAGMAVLHVRRGVAGKALWPSLKTRILLLCSGTANKWDATFFCCFWFAYKLL